MNNIGVTLLNKAAFAGVDFHYPYFLSAVHMMCNSLGSQYVFWSIGAGSASTLEPQKRSPSWISGLLGHIQRQPLDATGQRLILTFSVVFSLNIAIGNVSLRHVSVNFNQVMRSLVPAITIVMGWLVGKKTSVQKQLAVLPVVVGVAMACFGDMSFSALGFLYTVLCGTLFLPIICLPVPGVVGVAYCRLELISMPLHAHVNNIHRPTNSFASRAQSCC